jgi:O-methyltransferase
MIVKQRLSYYLHRLARAVYDAPVRGTVEPEFKSTGHLFTDFDPAFREIYARCKPFTLTGVESMYALHKAVKHVVQHDIAGALVECGVWRGGSMMNLMLSLMQANDTTREVYLYDTFQGMSKPTERDVKWNGTSAEKNWQAGYQSEDLNQWVYASLDEVRANVTATGYPEKQMHFVKGMVEETLPATLPGPIALLRLDTDFYESTRAELDYLYPLLVSGGILIIDDYGYWQGAQKAVDEYFAEHRIQMFLNRVDYTCRLGIKL